MRGIERQRLFPLSWADAKQHRSDTGYLLRRQRNYRRPPSEEAMKRDDPFYVKVGI
jgi:hypothetical protein